MKNRQKAILMKIIPAVVCLLVLFTAGPALSQIRIKDAAGIDIRLAKPPERIVVVGAAPFIPLHMLYMFDHAKTRLAGFESKIKRDDEFLLIIDPLYNEKKSLASQPGPESIAALHPDLVICKSSVQTPLSRSLKKAGIQVLHLGAETPQKFLRDITVLGDVFNDQERAKKLTGYFSGKLSLIRQRTASIRNEDKLKILSVEYSNRGRLLTLMVPSQSMIQTQQVVLSQGIPVWSDVVTAQDGWQLSGFEQIAAWNPDKIFMVVWHRMNGEKVLGRLYKDRRWKQLTAVQNDDLYLFPGDIYGWDTATPRWILGTWWMATKNYPDLFSADEKNVTKMAREFYRFVYGMDDQTVEREILPRVKQ